GEILAEGEHTLSVQATDEYGNTSEITEISFILDTSAPEIQLNLESLTELEEIDLTGETEPNSEVTLTETGVTTTSDENGIFTFEGVVLELGENSFTVETQDIAGNIGTTNQSITRLEAVLPPVNQSPFFTTEPDLEALIGQSYQTELTALDADGDPLTYHILSAPEGMTLAADGVTLEWSPESEAEGNHSIVVRVTDGRGGSDELSFTLAAIEQPPNRPPEVSSIPVVEGNVNQDYEYQVVASDPDGDHLSYSISAPEGLEIDPQGKITWTPSNEQVGVHEVTVSISDSKGGEVEQHYSILVQPEVGNTAPVIISEPKTQLALSQGQAPGVYQYDVDAVDADNDELVYGLVDAPEGMSINPETGEITWQVPDSFIEGGTELPNGVHLFFGEDSSEVDSDSTPIPIPNSKQARSEFLSHLDGWHLADFEQYAHGERVENHLAFVGTDSSSMTAQLSGSPPYLYVNKTSAGTTLDGAFPLSGVNHLHDFGGPNPQLAFDQPQVALGFFATDFADGGQSLSVDLTHIDGTTTNIPIPHTQPAYSGSALYVGLIDTENPFTQVTLVNSGNAHDGFGYDDILVATADQLSLSDSQEVTVEVKDRRAGVDRQTYTIDLSQESGSLSGQIYAEGERQILYTNDFEDTQQPLPEWDNGQYNDDPWIARSFLGKYGGRNLQVGEFHQTRLNLSELPEHDQVTLDFDLYIINSWSGGEFLGPDGWKLQVVDGETLLDTTFGSGYRYGEHALPQAYPNNVEDGILHPGGTGAADVKPDGFRDYRFGNAVYELSFTFDHTDSELALDFIGDTDEDIHNESWGLDNVRVSVTNNEGLEGWRVYLDQNNNGERDPGEPNTLTDANGNYTFTGLNPGDYTIRTEPKAGWNTTTPESSQHVVSLAGGESLTELDFTQDYSAEEIENHPPEFTNLAPENASVGELWRYDATATDPDNDNLSYFLSVGPEGMSVDPQTGTFVWTPTLEQAEQPHSVILGVDDSNGGIDLKAFQVNTQVEHPPVVTSEPPSTPLNAGTPYEYQIEATDPNLDALTFSVETDQPGITIDDNGLLNLETPVTGVHEVIITVEDGQGESATQTLTLEVVENAENTPPRLLSEPRTTATIGQPYIAQVQAIDDNGDKLAYSLDAPDQLGLSIDQNGQIYWTPTQAEHLGTHEITLTVNDGRGGQDSQTFNLTVSNQSQNQPPEITAAPPNSATLGTQYRYQMQGSDPDGDLLLWSLDQAPSGMSIHSTTGEITWTPTIEQLGEQEVAVRLTDSQGSYTGVIFTLTARGTNIAPLIVSTPLTETSLGSEYLYQVLAADPDGDALTFSFDQAPDGMSINEHGVITWTPTATGSEPISVLVTDAQGATTTHSYTLEVGANARNLAPTITSTPLSYGSAPGQEYTYQLSAVDPEEGENLTYQLLSSPENLILDPQTGLLQWTPSASQAGPHLVQVAAVDSQGLRGGQGFYLNVRNNSAPVILSAPNTELFESQTFRYNLRAIDPDGDNLSYQLSQAPEGMTIDGQGRIIWDAREGTYDSIEATVTDEYGATVTQSIPLQVSLDEENPQVSLFQSFDFAYPNQEVLFAVQGSDNLGIAEKGLTINGTPVPLDAWGTAQWTFAAPGVYQIGATVLDKAGNETTETFEFTVAPFPGDEVIDFNLNLPEGEISEATELLGEITAEKGLQSYKVEVAPVGTDNFITLFEQQGEVENGVLGTFDPTLLANGAYTLRVSAIDHNNFESYTQTEVEVSSGLKLGNFQLSFTDLEIPVTGIPISVTRTYDSLYAHEQENFGQGWRLEFRDTNLQTSVAPPSPEQELLGRPNGFQEGDKVYITLPGGKRETFTFAPEIHPDVNTALRMGAPWPQSALFYVPKFVSEEGSGLTLSVKETSVLRKNTGEYISPNGLGYNPSHYLFGGRYTLTTAEGIEYEIDARSGDLLQVKDLNGNTLNYSDAGIVSSTGVEVKFERDSQGRIAKVIDPAGEEIRYNYDENGDLVSVVDREGNETKYYYENEQRAHYLTRIEDPLGREGIRVEYGEDGRLSRTIDVNGEAVELVYDTEGQTQVVKDLYGKETFYAYDQNGNITQEIQPSGLKIERTYARDKVISETVYTAESGAEGWTTSYEYDHWGNLSKETDPLGNVTLYTSDRKKRLLSETDALGNTTKYEYDYPGNLLSSTDALGNTTEYSYDARGNLLTLKTGTNTINFDYTINGRGTSIVDDLGNKGEYEYNGNGLQTKETLTIQTPEGQQTIITEWEYDDQGRMTKQTQGDNSIEYQYDANGNQIATLSNGITTEYRYDKKGQLVETLYDDNSKTVTLYDKGGRERASISAEGSITYYEYDVAGRLTKTLYPDNSDNQIEQLLAVIAPNETAETIDWTEVVFPLETPAYLNTRTYSRTEYTQDGRVKAEIDSNNNRTEYKYDAIGRQIEVKSDENNWVRYTYDTAGNRRTETYYAEGTSWSNTYDDKGRVIAFTDPNNKVIRYEYHQSGQLKAIIDPRQGKTAYKYDENGQLTQVTDALGQVTKYEYNDEQNRLTAVILDNGKRSTTAYNDEENSVTVTDFNGDAIKYVYDESGSLQHKELLASGTSVSYGYDETTRTETITSERGTTVYQYDELGQLISRTDPEGPYLESGASLEYTYEEGYLTGVKTPSREIGYGYDEEGNLASVTTDEGTTVYEYLNGELVKTIFPNDTAEIIVYDALGRIDVIETVKVDSNTGETLEVLASFDYEVDDVGNREKVTDHEGRVVEYKYDELNRVIEEKITHPIEGERTISYVYDEVGNRLRKEDSLEGLTTYQYENNLLISETQGNRVTTYKYDNNGNLISRLENGTDKTIYTWDDENRLIGVQTPNGDSISYGYNDKNIRVSSTVNGVQTNYLIDSNRPYSQVIEEYQQGELKSSYVYGLDLISQAQGEDSYFYHVDGLGSTIALSNASSALTDSYVYDAYGNLIDSTGETLNLYRFAGEQYDPNVEQYYLRQRYYDPKVGRFTRRDTYEGRLNEPMTLHKYLYAHANPVNNIDPTGLFSLGEVAAARQIRNTLASIQFDSYSYLVSATLGYSQGKGDYKIGDFFLELSFNAFFSLAPVLAPYMISGVKGMIRRLGNRTRGGAGIGKKVPIFDEIESLSIIQQPTNQSCGVTCGAQILQDMGIDVSPSAIARAAGDEFVNAKELSKGLNMVTNDTSKVWYGQQVPQLSKRAINMLNETGPWIAQIGENFNRHWIIIDGFNEAGKLKIRDPWGLSEIYKYIGKGTQYSVDWEDFSNIWTGLVVYRN
ncbi:putative Ig domain-containing protein, partial [Roseofilum reptotaenium CS-1145]